MNTERRRSERYSALEEIAIVHDHGEDRPGTLMDFSMNGVLVQLVDLPGMSPCLAAVNAQLGLSFQWDDSQFHVDVRVARQGPQFLALEFVDSRLEALDVIGEKVRQLSFRA